MPTVVKVPLGPPSLEGLANLRGRVLPVVSLRVCCDMAPAEHDETTRVIVVDGGVSSCLGSDNACTGVPPGVVPFIFGGTAHGPVVDCSAGGDINQVYPVSSHHCTNWVY